ncbi:hypothetical protein [Rhodovulum marinum]|uniref:Uncharacterized protein n=1 Tax=Rhodovulum marinum TaxID=320662 RepID=A0A4R2Q1V1_9RHOB|nr:hypothetical protein [Rhodovulum marinum]TCP40571.1 hypothetical protein EV662_107182 [Rhodovulum marinum]
MKSIKYELLGFSGLVGALMLVLLLPGGEQERETIKALADGMVSMQAFDPE